MSRTVRRLATLLLALGLGQFAVFVTPAYACACGAVITHSQDTRVADETSLVRYRQGTEDIVMSLGLTGSPSSAAWFLPVPAKPTFALADERLFNTLADLTAPRVVVDNENGCSDSCAAAPQQRPSPDVSVVQRVPVGPYDVATLKASNGDALHDWLASHGFTLSAKLARGIKPYAAEHWLFVAVRLNPAKGHRTLGTQLPPLKVSFASHELVYPMRLTALATHPQTVRLYILADHRMRADGNGPTESDVRWAGWLTPGSVRGGPLASLVPHRMFLTRFDQVDLQPSQVHGDYYFRRAGADTPYRRVIRQDSGPTLAGANDRWLTTSLVPLVGGLAVFLSAACAAGAIMLYRRYR